MHEQLVRRRKCGEKKAGGEDCGKDDEMHERSSMLGQRSARRPRRPAARTSARASDECDSSSLQVGKCGGGDSSSSSRMPRVWIGVSVWPSMKLYLMPGAPSNVCSLTTW